MKAGFTMKALSLAVLGLAGLGFGASAFAACPAALSPPWSSINAGGGGAVSAVDVGYNGTSCKMQAALGAALGTTARASVVDDTPADETHYRARFYMNASAFSGLTTTRQTRVFSANAANQFPVSGGFLQIVRVDLLGVGGVPTLRFFVADTAGTSPGATCSGNRCFKDVALSGDPNGTYRVEIDAQIGNGTGQMRYWVTPAGTASTDGSPTGTITGLNNSGWVGVSQAVLGLFNLSPSFRTAYINQNAFFDEFDSRRSTFIGQ